MKSKTDNTCICNRKKTSIGGQALIEGIMMRGPKKISMAVRNPDGEMVIENWENDDQEKPTYYKAPFLRGIFGFIDSMKFGYKCLMRSAEIAGLDDVDENSKKNIVKKDNADDLNSDAVDCEKNADVDKSEKKDDSQNKIMMNVIMVVASILGIVLALVLFKGLPETLYEVLKKLIPLLDGEGYGYRLIRSLFVGVFKIIILVTYMALVSLMKDIRRTFMYHGAEHKSIACYESGLELTVENVKKQRRFHPRCGTSFLIVMVIVGIFVTMFIPATLSENGILNVILRTVISIVLLPLMMSIGYELIKLAGKHDNIFTRIISAPGIWLQRITTKEPDDSMIECAITALKNVIPEDGSDDWNNK